MKDVDELPENFNSLAELQEFWDTRSSADYEHFMTPVEFEVESSAKRKIYCAVDNDLYVEVQEHARNQGVSVETLINLWLREKLAERAEA